jgi:isocitrate lyase
MGVCFLPQELERFVGDVGKEGYVWQFITLAGFHVNGLVTTYSLNVP